MKGTLIVEINDFRLVFIKIYMYILAEERKWKEFLLWGESDRLGIVHIALKAEPPSTNGYRPLKIKTLGKVECWINRSLSSVVENELQSFIVGELWKAEPWGQVQLGRGVRKSSGYKENKDSALSEEAGMGDGDRVATVEIWLSFVYPITA